MLFKNTQSSYGLVTILFHWIIAIIILGMIPLGLYMTDQPIGLYKLKLYGWHKEFGILVLMLAILRVAWWFSNITPSLADLPRWERISARSVHFAFYIFLFAMPITGWMISSASNVPVSFFGLFVLPDLIGPDEKMRVLLENVHSTLAFLLIAVIILHVAASLKHYFIDKDNILQRMLWPW